MQKLFSSSFDRVAAYRQINLGKREYVFEVGWLDVQGAFTNASQEIPASDFDRVNDYALGFDKANAFWFVRLTNKESSVVYRISVGGAPKKVASYDYDANIHLDAFERRVFEDDELLAWLPLRGKTGCGMALTLVSRANDVDRNSNKCLGYSSGALAKWSAVEYGAPSNPVKLFDLKDRTVLTPVFDPSADEVAFIGKSPKDGGWNIYRLPSGSPSPELVDTDLTITELSWLIDWV